NEKLSKSEEKLHNQALQTAHLIEKYGKAAAVAFCARRMQPSDVKAVLEKEPKLNDRFYELVLEAERKAMSKRFWRNDRLQSPRVTVPSHFEKDLKTMVRCFRAQAPVPQSGQHKAFCE